MTHTTTTITISFAMWVCPSQRFPNALPACDDCVTLGVFSSSNCTFDCCCGTVSSLVTLCVSALIAAI